MFVRIQKITLLLFVSFARIWVLSNRVEDETLLRFFLFKLYPFDLIFSVIVCIDKYHNCGEESVSLTMVAIEIGKGHLFSFHRNCCKEEKILHQKHRPFTFELPLTKLSWLEKYKTRKNVSISTRYIFSQMIQKLKNNVLSHDYLPQLCC